AASLLFFGAYRSRRELWVPVVLLAASDVLLNRFVYHYPFSWDLVVTWAWYAAALGLGASLRGRIKPLWIMGSAAATSVSFYLLSLGWLCCTGIGERRLSIHPNCSNPK